MLTGKTTIGKALAVRLEKEFVEMDAEIESLSGQPIPNLFLKGEEHFRDWEEKVCKIIAKRNNAVISCGGGVILRQSNIETLQHTSTIILLQASSDVICNRFLKSEAASRPLLKVEDPLGEIQRLLRNRKILYENAADIHIAVDMPINKVVDDIINRLQMRR